MSKSNVRFISEEDFDTGIETRTMAAELEIGGAAELRIETPGGIVASSVVVSSVETFDEGEDLVHFVRAAIDRDHEHLHQLNGDSMRRVDPPCGRGYFAGDISSGFNALLAKQHVDIPTN